MATTATASSATSSSTSAGSTSNTLNNLIRFVSAPITLTSPLLNNRGHNNSSSDSIRKYENQLASIDSYTTRYSFSTFFSSNSSNYYFFVAFLFKGQTWIWRIWWQTHSFSYIRGESWRISLRAIWQQGTRFPKKFPNICIKFQYKSHYVFAANSTRHTKEPQSTRSMNLRMN